MPNKPSPQDMRELWQKQQVETMNIPIEEIQRKAAAFQKRITRRNLREYVACVFVLLAFTWFFAITPKPVPRIAFGLIIAAAIFVAWQLLTRGTAQTVPADLGGADCLQFHRRELERQRNLLRNIWRWYLGPFIPGMALITALSIVSTPKGKLWFPIVFAGCEVMFFWWTGQINKRAARRLDRQIAEIDAMTAPDQ